LGKVNIEHEMINKIRLNSFFSTLWLKIAHALQHLLLVENTKKGMVLL
jgi:hypothetical protein